MESDAYAAYVSVDMELQKPLFSVGIIGGTQYADAEDAAGAAGTTRRFRHSLEVLKRAVQLWQLDTSLAFVAHLGNVLAAENAAAEAQWPALARFHEEAGRCTSCKQWHATAGEHDLRCFGAEQLSALSPTPSPHAKLAEHVRYYAFSPSPGWRVLVLDAFDVSLLAHTPGSEAHSAALALLARENPNPADAADPLAGLSGEARRWGPSGGGVGPAQMSWFKAQLETAEESNERVLVLCHLSCLPDAVSPEGLLFNFSEVQATIDAHPGIVAAWLSAGDTAGSYARDKHGVHYIVPCAAVLCEVNEDAFGVLQVFGDRMKLQMVGRPPSAELRPQGWPEALALPQGGKLVASSAFSWGQLGFIVQMWLMLFRTVASALPVFRLLYSEETASAASPAAAAADPAVSQPQEQPAEELSAPAPAPPDGELV